MERHVVEIPPRVPTRSSGMRSGPCDRDGGLGHVLSSGMADPMGRSCSLSQLERLELFGPSLNYAGNLPIYQLSANRRSLSDNNLEHAPRGG